MHRFLLDSCNAQWPKVLLGQLAREGRPKKYGEITDFFINMPNKFDHCRKAREERREIRRKSEKRIRVFLKV